MHILGMTIENWTKFWTQKESETTIRKKSKNCGLPWVNPLIYGGFSLGTESAQKKIDELPSQAYMLRYHIVKKYEILYIKTF